MSRQESAVGSGGDDDNRSRRSLLYATAILLVLMLIMSVAAHIVKLRPAALVGFPVMIIGATALILTLLYLVGPNPEAAEGDTVETAVRAALMPAVAVNVRNDRILAANDEATAIVGASRLAVGNHFGDLFADESPGVCREIVEAAATHGRAEVEACALHVHTGEQLIVRLAARRYKAVDANDLTFVVVGFDSNETNDAVAQFARVQERLMSNISHELRTPLNVVMGFSELLTTGTLGEMPDNQLDAAAECHEGGERILRLINDILDVGRSRSYYTASEERPIAPVEMIRRIENLLAGQARRETLQLETQVEPGLPQIETEERAFKQLIYHLLLSSMDRSQPGSVVRIAARQDGDRLALTVTDSGTELSEPVQAGRVPVVSTDHARDTLAPPLLGLPLCAYLAERLGSPLTVSTDQEGVHFEVRLPWKPL